MARSDPTSEFLEMVLKAKALLYTLTGNPPSKPIPLQGSSLPVSSVVYKTEVTALKPSLGQQHSLLETM